MHMTIKNFAQLNRKPKKLNKTVSPWVLFVANNVIFYSNTNLRSIKLSVGKMFSGFFLTEYLLVLNLLFPVNSQYNNDELLTWSTTLNQKFNFPYLQYISALCIHVA